MRKKRTIVKKQDRTKATKYLQLLEDNRISKNHPTDPEPIAESRNPTNNAEIKPRKRFRKTTRTETNKTKQYQIQPFDTREKHSTIKEKSREKNDPANLPEASK